MGDFNTEIGHTKNIIDGIDLTNETLTGRGGLSLFVRYLRGIGLYGSLE